MYVDVNLSLKMSLNLKIFGVLKNTFFTVGGLIRAFPSVTSDVELQLRALVKMAQQLLHTLCSNFLPVINVTRGRCVCSYHFYVVLF